MTPEEVPRLTADFSLSVAHRDEYAAPFRTDRGEVVHLLREPLDVVLPRGHHLDRRRRARLIDLAGEQWIS
jgi:hypothetical protein